MDSMVSKTFLKVLSIGCKVFIATFIALFVFIGAVAFIGACMGDGIIGFAGCVAAALIAVALVELYKTI